MINNFDSLLEQVISLWPHSIVVADQILYENGGATILCLTKVHETVKEIIFSLDDNDMLIQMDWAIYTILHQEARNNALITPANVDKEKVRAIFYRNLGLSNAARVT